MTALVERWRPESHTFHLLTGECRITLEDIALQMSLHVDGKLITGPTYYDWEQMFVEYALVGSTLKLKWLKEHMLTLPAEPTLQQLVGHCRACILGLIGGVLMPNKLGNRVHLMYLPLLG